MKALKQRITFSPFRNKWIVREEEAGYARELLERHLTRTQESALTQRIKRMSVMEIIG